MTSIQETANKAKAKNFFDLPSDIRLQILDLVEIGDNTLIVTSPNRLHWSKPIPSIIFAGLKFREDVTPKLASRTTIKVYGNSVDHLLCRIPDFFLAHVKRVRLMSTYPSLLDKHLARLPKLETVEISLEWAALCNKQIQMNVPYSFGWGDRGRDISFTNEAGSVDKILIRAVKKALGKGKNAWINHRFDVLFRASFLLKNPNTDRAVSISRALINIEKEIVVDGGTPG